MIERFTDKNLELIVENNKFTTISKPPFWQTNADTNNNISVAISTWTTPDLLCEGIIRDITHYTNNMRKETGLSITDRIELTVFPLAAHVVFQIAIEKYMDELKRDTLSDFIYSCFGAEDLTYKTVKTSTFNLPFQIAIEKSLNQDYINRMQPEIEKYKLEMANGKTI